MIHIKVRRLFDEPIIRTKFTVHSQRLFGEAKSIKPKELKNTKQKTSISYINRCKCPLFVLGQDVYIKHSDWFSPTLEPTQEDIDATHGNITPKYLLQKYFNRKGRNEKFIYPDSFGDAVLRQEAWIILKDIMLDIEEVHQLDLRHSICQQIVDYFDVDEWLHVDMESFFERAINYLYNNKS